MDEEYLLTIDFQSEKPDLTLPYKLIGLESDTPVLQIGHEVYSGEWTTTVGTEMIFNETGEWVANVTRRLLMSKVEICKKGQEQEQSKKPQMLRGQVSTTRIATDTNGKTVDERTTTESTIAPADNNDNETTYGHAAESDVSMADA